MPGEASPTQAAGVAPSKIPHKAPSDGEYDGLVDVESSEISVVTVLPNGKPRLRQYAEGNDFTKQDANGYGLTNQHCNEYERFFVEASQDWSDWGYGFTGEGNYTFGIPAALSTGLHDPELLKAQAFKETQMSPNIAVQNSPGHPHDIMQLEAKGSETDEMNNGKRKTFNASATKVRITGQKFIPASDGVPDHYEASAEHEVYLYDGDHTVGADPAPATNYGYVAMWYQTHVGPANSNSEQTNIKWALRDLILKSHVTQSIEIKPIGAGKTRYGLDPQWRASITEVLDSYGPIEAGGYGNAVLKFKYEGRKGAKFGWPRLATKTARR
jgi:hypothetical protein